MPREIRTELSTLINSGRCAWHTTYDIVLTDGEDLFLSTGEILVNRFGKNQQYLARVLPDVGELSLSSDVEVDGQEFKTTNVDLVIGQLLTTSVRRMDGAQVIIGILFLEIGQPASQAIWDAKIKASLVAGEISDESVAFTAVSQVDLVVVSGRSISNEFQWQEPVSIAPVIDPNDIPPHRDPNDDSPGRGRYGEIEFPRFYN